MLSPAPNGSGIGRAASGALAVCAGLTVQVFAHQRVQHCIMRTTLEQKPLAQYAFTLHSRFLSHITAPVSMITTAAL
jgi:hypothetical protein